MEWYNWLALGIFIATAITYYTLNLLEDDVSPGVRAGREACYVIAAGCVVMFLLQGLDILQAAR